MATSRYAEEDADFAFKGDTVTVDGTLTVTGVTTLTGGQATLKLTSGPSGTAAGTVWTSGPPAFTSTQMYILCTAGSTTYRIPVFANA